jgi:hypothetical protein
MKKTLILAGLVLLAASCSSSTEKEDGEVYSSVAAGGQEDQEFLQENKQKIAAEEARQREEASQVTTFTFDKAEHDFGSIKLESENSCVFKITNTGTKPLIIYNVGASCGCTTPKKPEKPIPPGKSDLLEVGFKPNSTGEISKTVTVQANTEPRVSTVKIKAKVS